MEPVSTRGKDAESVVWRHRRQRTDEDRVRDILLYTPFGNEDDENENLREQIQTEAKQIVDFAKAHHDPSAEPTLNAPAVRMLMWYSAARYYRDRKTKTLPEKGHGSKTRRALENLPGLDRRPSDLLDYTKEELLELVRELHDSELTWSDCFDHRVPLFALLGCRYQALQACIAYIHQREKMNVEEKDPEITAMILRLAKHQIHYTLGFILDLDHVIAYTLGFILNSDHGIVGDGNPRSQKSEISAAAAAGKVFRAEALVQFPALYDEYCRLMPLILNQIAESKDCLLCYKWMLPLEMVPMKSCSCSFYCKKCANARPELLDKPCPIRKCTRGDDIGSSSSDKLPGTGNCTP